MVVFHSLFRTQLRIEKAMGDSEVAHGLYSQFRSLGWHRADFSLFFLPAPPIHTFQRFHIFHFVQIVKTIPFINK
jgi:hypothetical protein